MDDKEFAQWFREKYSKHESRAGIRFLAVVTAPLFFVIPGKKIIESDDLLMLIALAILLIGWIVVFYMASKYDKEICPECWSKSLVCQSYGIAGCKSSCINCGFEFDWGSGRAKKP